MRFSRKNNPVSSRSCCSRITITFDKNTRGCGILLRMDDNMEYGYYIRLEPRRNRLVFDRWPRNGDCPFAVELERPVGLISKQRNNIKIVVDDTMCVVYFNDIIAMSTRLYNFPKGRWGVFVSEGNAVFENTRLWV